MSEKERLDFKDPDRLEGPGDGDSAGLDFQTIFAALVLNWQWFLLSLVICISGALIYLRYAEPVFEFSSRMLIKDEQKRPTSMNSQMLGSMEALGIMTNSAGIDNEIEVLQSRILLRDVVKELKLYTEYRYQGRVRRPLVYGTQPVSFDLDPIHLDTLDYALLSSEKSLKMELIRKGNGYEVSGSVLDDDEEQSNFLCTIDTLPSSFETPLGTVTMTANGERMLGPDTTYYISIRPPMQVATEYLAKMSVEPTSKLTSIASITLKDKNTRRGIDFLRQLAVCYNRQANADKNEIAIRTEEFINDRIDKINGELGATERFLEDFKRNNAVTNLEVDASQSVQMSSRYSAELSEANAQIQILDDLREYVDNPANRYCIIPSNVGMTDGASTSLIASYNEAVQNRNRLLKAASEKAPQVQTLTATIDELESSIRAALLQARRTADINRQGIRSQYEKYQGRVSSTPVQERVLTQEGRQQDVKSGLYLMLLQKREENAISLAATADKGKLIDEPLLVGAVSPKKLVVLGASLLLGLLLPGGIIYLIALFRYKVEGHEDVVRLTDLPIIADVAVASDGVKTKAGIVVQANKNNQIDEIFRSMRTNIQFMLKGDQKIIMFTSSTSGEGKTFNAANLAVSFALLGKKVVLCGLDIRKPALGRLFGISDRFEGITSLLAMDSVSEVELNSQLARSGVNENLDLLLAGPVPPNPTELLARDTFGKIVEMLRSRYDYVIFDTAPVGLVTDTLQIGRYADVTVFVCRADYTPKSSFGLFNNLAAEKKLPSPCIVINGIDMSRRKYGYYYGYGKYGRYGRYGYGRYGYGRYGYGNYGNYGSYGQYAESHYGNKDDNSIKK